MCKIKQTKIHHQNITYPSRENHQLWGKALSTVACPRPKLLKKDRSTLLLHPWLFQCPKRPVGRNRGLEVPGVVSTPPLGPLLIHPPVQDFLHVCPVVEPAELHQLAHRPLTVPEQELQGGTLRPLLEETQFVIGHAPFACKIPPVFYCRVTWIQLYPDDI